MGATTRDTSAGPSGRELVLATLAEHAESLERVARRYSLCADDAQDAYQRAVEIFLRRADRLGPEGAPAWLRTVVKHEALAVRAARLRLVGPAEVDLDGTEAREAVGAEERVAARERFDRSTEALNRLKPQEIRALVLKARGYSYREIADITGWTYTKVNRCLTEGRRAFLDRFADIEAGRECERWAGVLSALADGEADAAAVAALRPHLRNCATCRARLRENRTAPRSVAALAPLAVADSLSHEGPGFVTRAYEAIVGGLHDRATLAAHKLQAGLEAVSAGKVAAAAASATALAGGGAAVLNDSTAPPSSAPAARVDRPRASETANSRRAGQAVPVPQAPSPSKAAPPAPAAKRGPDLRPPGPEPTAGSAAAGEFDPAPARPAPAQPAAELAPAEPPAPAPTRTPAQPSPGSASAEFGP